MEARSIVRCSRCRPAVEDSQLDGYLANELIRIYLPEELDDMGPNPLKGF